MKNIVLIGMMACGKTTCANLLHEKLGWPVIDTDALIVEREGRSINDIFAAEGEEYFRRLETDLCRELNGAGGQIIATGGGLPLRWENAEILRKNGVVFWLKRDPAVTYDSVSMGDRPLAQQGREAFIQRFIDRTPKYQRACHVVIEDFTSPEITVSEILKSFEEAEQTN